MHIHQCMKVPVPAHAWCVSIMHMGLLELCVVGRPEPHTDVATVGELTRTRKQALSTYRLESTVGACVYRCLWRYLII